MSAVKQDKSSIKVLIVDDHSLVRLGIRRLLEDVPNITVVAEAQSGEDAIGVVRETPPDVVLLDVKMPGIGGLETTRRILRTHPGIKIIAVTAFHDDPYPSRILQAGAAGYLTKECGLEEMVTAIEKVHTGQRYISPEIAQKLALKSISEPSPDASPFEALSERELQVMLMITNGLKVQQISEKLCLSPKTVNSYRYRIFDKLKVANDVELTLMAIQHGLLDKSSATEEES
jgi:two-component system, NarL family, invasion response regulator UvrY